MEEVFVEIRDYLISNGWKQLQSPNPLHACWENLKFGTSNENMFSAMGMQMEKDYRLGKQIRLLVIPPKPKE